MEPNPNPPVSPAPSPAEVPTSPHSPGQVIAPESPPSQPTSSVVDTAAIYPPTDQSSSISPITPLSRDNFSSSKAKPSFLGRFRRRAIVLPAVIILVLLGGSATAYFGYYVPSKPQSILMKAVKNSLLEHQITSTGSFDFNNQSLAGKADFTVKTNTDKHSFDLNLTPVVSGINLPIEVLGANSNLYIKLGDLTSLKPLLSLVPNTDGIESSILIGLVNQIAGNQWIAIDSTLIKEAKLSCLSDFPAPFTNSDVQALQTSYKQKPFVAITSHSTDIVNGASAYKYSVQLNDNTLSGFGLASAPFFKGLNNCLSSISPGSKLDLSSLKDNDKTPLTVWVDKKTKHIVKYSSQSTNQDSAKGVTGSFTGTISYGPVDITEPKNAKPILTVLGNFGASSLLDGSKIGATAADTERKTDVNALQSQLEVYKATNGYYPTLASLNDPSWRAKNLQSLDSNALKDPAGSASTLAAKPAKDVYSYVVTPATCDNGTHGNCNSYTLTATLDDGSHYVKQALK